MRPAQSALMAESDSRTTRRTLRFDVFQAGWHGKNVASGKFSKTESLLAVADENERETESGTRRLMGKTAVCQSEFRIRLTQGASTWTGKAQKVCVVAFGKLILMKNSVLETVEAVALHRKRQLRYGCIDHMDRLLRINPTARPSSSKGSPGCTTMGLKSGFSDSNSIRRWLR